MPMPTTIEMNMTENSDRWPGKIVATPTDQARLIDSTIVMAIGLPIRLNPSSSSPSGRTTETTLAYSLSRKAQVEEAAHEGLGDLGGHALHELIEGGAGREGLHEVLVVEDAVADLLQLVLGQVEERAALELLGVDAVVDAGERHARGLDLAHE